MSSTSASGPRVTGLGCPRCGGVLEVETGRRVVTCPFCSASLLATGEHGLRRLLVEPHIQSAAAREAVTRWLGKGWKKDPALRREAEISEAFLCLVPFYRSEADVIGHAFGTEERTRTVGSGKNRRTERYEVDVEKRVERSGEHIAPAVNLAEWGVYRVNLQGDALVPFDLERAEKLGMVFSPATSEVEAREEGLGAIKAEADPAAGLKRVRFRFLETVRERFSLVYYPLWMVRYRFRGRGYPVVIDAEDGSLAYGKAPGNDFFRATILVSTLGAVSFAVTTVIQWALSETDGDLFKLALGVGVVGLGAIVWAFRQFRYGGVVEEGSGKRDSAAMALSSIADWAKKRGLPS